MRRRSRNFWDGVEGRAPKPRAAATLGWEFVDADVEEGTIEVSDTVGPALLATLEPGRFISTMELKASFLRPVSPGRIFGSGRVIRRDGDIAFLEGALSDTDREIVATATATARVITVEPTAR